MAVLKVRRPSPGKRELLLQGTWLPLGAEIDTGNFPQVSETKWAQLIRQGIFDDDHLADPDLKRELDAQVREFGSARVVESRPDPGMPVPLDPEDIARLEKPIALMCGECGFQANSDHGLKIHIGRKHA